MPILELPKLPEKRHFAQTEHKNAKKTKLSETNSTKCGVCGLTFSNKQDFVEHYKKHENTKKSKLLTKCGVCGLTFSNKPNFVKHYKVWQYGLWSFQAGGTILERFLHKNQHTRIFNFEFWINGELSKIGHNFSNKVM